MKNLWRNLQHFVLICVILLFYLIAYNNSPKAFRLKRNTAPDGVVLDSVNVLPGTNILLSQEGKTVSITCKQSSSTATDVEFQLQVYHGGTWTALPTASAPVWDVVLDAGNIYKCVATNSAGIKGSHIYESDVISIKINENPCKLHEFKPSLACTCKATSKIGNSNMAVKWYADGFTEGSTDIDQIPDQGVNTPVKDGVINRNQMRFNLMLYAILIQCRLWKYNGIELPKLTLQEQILHQTPMNVTYFPDEIQTPDTFTGEPDIRNEGDVVEYTCRTVIGRPDPTVIYQQKRRGSEQWEPIPDPQPRKVPLKMGLKGFDTTYKFNADFKLHNGTSFRCAVKENLTFPEPQQFNPIIVHYFAAPVYKKSSENKTHAAYIVTVNSNPLTQQVTCDPPAVVQKLSNSQWNITIPIVNSTTTDYRGRCLTDGINERVIDVAGYHHAGPTDEPDAGNGGRVFGAVIGILILLILIILFILWRRGCLPCLVPKPEDAIALLRWTSETWYEKDHEYWVKTREQLQPVKTEDFEVIEKSFSPEIFRIIKDVYGTENDWELTRDKDKQAIAIREFLFGQLSSDQSVLDLVKEILRKYVRINNLKTKLSNEIDTLLNKKRSIDGADVVYNRDEDEVHVSFMTQSNEEKKPLTDKEKQFIRDVASAVESIDAFFAKMSDAELCERGIFNIKPTDEIADMFVKETLQTEVKQQNENLVTQIENQKVTDETRTEMEVADRKRFVNKDICVLLGSSLQKLEENKHSTELDKSIYEISRDVLEIKLKIAVFKSIRELYAGRAERFQKELKEKLKQEENKERKNEEELNRIIHSSVCQAFKYITDMNEKTLVDSNVVRYGVSPEEINSKLRELADKEFKDRTVGRFKGIKTPEEIVTVTLNIPTQLRTDLYSAGRDPVILPDRAVEYFKDEFISAIQSDESLKTATQTALDNESSKINELLRKEKSNVNRIYGEVKKRIESMSTEELNEQGIVVYRIKDETAMSNIKPIIADRIQTEFKDSLVTVLEEKCQKAISLWPSKHWEYDISRAMSVLSEFTSRTLNTNTGYWKQVKECFGDEINSETNTTELTEIVDECSGECIKTMSDKWNPDAFKHNKMITGTARGINFKLHELADKEFEDRKRERVSVFNQIKTPDDHIKTQEASFERVKTPEEILPLTLIIPAQLSTELDSANRHPDILWDKAVEYFKDEFISAIQSDESLKTATQTALDKNSSEINNLLKRENWKVDGIYNDVKNRIQSMSTEKLKERGIVAYRIKDEIAMFHIKPIIANRIPQFKDSLETVLEEKCKKASGLSTNSSINPTKWTLSKQWVYDISRAISVLSEFTSRTLKTNTGYWKQVKECFGDKIDGETNTTELTKIVDECLRECTKTMNDKWITDDFKIRNMIVETKIEEIVNKVKHEYFQTREFRRSVETAVNEAIQNSEKSQAGKTPNYEAAVQWIAAEMKDFTVKPSETSYERNEFARLARATVTRKSRELMDEIRAITDKGELKKLGFLVEESKKLKERGIVAYRIKDETALKHIKQIIANRIPGFKDSLVTVLEEKCKDARSMWSSKHWAYDISRAMSELSEFTSRTLKTGTGYWKQVKECYGDEINGETNTTELTEIVTECLGECSKTMRDKWNTDYFKNRKMIVETDEIVDEIKREYFQTPEFRRSVETAVNEAIKNSEKSQAGKKPNYEVAVKWIADEMKDFTVKPSEIYELNEFAKIAQPKVMRKSRELMDKIRAITDKGELKKLGFLVEESRA
ncbi:uncharacterized protein LOC141907883 isoform X2 [Tubulanus polymorphus]|uniref:uncharacterized protein LOC141907883 isoform X2 n=1 Tax=Tubulanus polymorphus TaxID=672921 RepID=UPI003DA2FD49